LQEQNAAVRRFYDPTCRSHCEASGARVRTSREVPEGRFKSGTRKPIPTFASSRDLKCPENIIATSSSDPTLRSYGLRGSRDSLCRATYSFAVGSNDRIQRRTVRWRRECQSTPIERQSIFDLLRPKPTIRATAENWRFASKFSWNPLWLIQLLAQPFNFRRRWTAELVGVAL
jgi:hypothetical protein